MRKIGEENMRADLYQRNYKKYDEMPYDLYTNQWNMGNRKNICIKRDFKRKNVLLKEITGKDSTV